MMLVCPPLLISGAPVLATAILLLATGRAWRSHRRFVESVACACLLGSAAAALAPLPDVVFRALLPLAAVGAAWVACAYAAWRFAPDCGQRGFLWTLPAAAGRSAPLALAAGLVTTPFAWLAPVIL